MPKLFKEFVDHMERENRRHLKIVKKLLESRGMKVNSFIDEDDPYIFVHSTNRKCSFDGIRVYHIGSQLAFRVQKEAKTHPFGKAYPLDIDEMFSDLLSDYEPKQAGHQVIETVTKDIKRFFDSSAKAEDQLESDPMADDPFDKIIVRSTGTDYADKVQQRGG